MLSVDRGVPFSVRSFAEAFLSNLMFSDLALPGRTQELNVLISGMGWLFLLFC